MTMHKTNELKLCGQSKRSPLGSNLVEQTPECVLNGRVRSLRCFLCRSSHGVCSGLTTQAQRPGARDAWIATATLSPGSLQRLVRPSSFVIHYSKSRT
jgi:hypothetical protein